jgi:hypothetical protein
MKGILCDLLLIALTEGTPLVVMQGILLVRSIVVIQLVPVVTPLLCSQVHTSVSDLSTVVNGRHHLLLSSVLG